MTRVICIGHSLLAQDNAGPLLYQRLKTLSLGERVELIDGGLQGLTLLRYFDNCQRVILIDNVCGYLPEPGVIHLQGEQIQAAVNRHFDHSAGLAYLLALLPELLEQIPAIDLLGIEGELSDKLAIQAIVQPRQLLEGRSAA